jgi:AcrR family transcriptional regulator
LAKNSPRWRRRKAERPGEILAAALQVFAEKGFAAARLDEIAERAGVSKGALFLYFENKEALFRAVVRDLASPDLDAAEELAAGFHGRFAELTPLILALIARLAPSRSLGAAARLVIAEARTFPDLAQAWQEGVVSRALDLAARVIAAAQSRGEVRDGDARLYAVSLMGPLLMAAIWDEAFAPAGAEPIDLAALAAQHARTALRGMLADPP